MKITRADVLSPANAVSLVGLVMTIYGSLHISSLSGVLILGLGRFIDIFDGKVARATHVSPFGALVDATCDKIGIAVLVPAAWMAHIAPYWLLVYILVQNILNVVFSALTAARGGVPAASRYGKYTMFIQNISLGCYALGTVTDIRFFSILGLILGIGSIFWAIRATYGYAKMLPDKKTVNQ
jgi:phosphatidylglycerophosphate synthase